MGEIYHAHYREADGRYQSVKEHNRNVAVLAEEYCAIGLLKKAAYLAGLLHDAGKATARWQEYFEKSVHGEKGIGQKMDHSTMGGLMAAEIKKSGVICEMVENAIYMHHGLEDCISLEDNSAFIEKRRRKKEGAVLPETEAVCGIGRDEVVSLYKQASKDCAELLEQIKRMKNLQSYTPQNCEFYLGMCQRMLFSALIDADWRDTADFMDGVAGRGGAAVPGDGERCIWEAAVEAVERDIAGLPVRTPLDPVRAEISEKCRVAAASDDTLYRLAVPTGAGKTKSSLRFALHHALKYGKRHIFYIAPFRSLLEQNADVIRKTLREVPGSDRLVLEHHSDVVPDSEGAEDRYERLIENWDEVPIIVTTAVQFFNTLFLERRSNVRRFHSLCNSVIIMDEVQALPVKLVHLFNLSVNFLTRICNTTVVLCTATQPLFDKVRDNRMLPPVDMAGELSDYEKHFRRVEYHDCLEDCGEGFGAEEAADFIRNRAREFRQVLMIVNTKACAQEIYERLKGSVEGRLLHLSTSMCPLHRKEVLKEVRGLLGEGGCEGEARPLICITTQLVEAGVDFSFPCVVRSLAGLDNLIQAAGRCNRHGSDEPGHVYLVKMSPEVERLTALEDIRAARDAMEQLLWKYRAEPADFDNRLDSGKAIGEYYRIYYHSRQKEMGFSTKTKEGDSVDLVGLLSHNPKWEGGHKNLKFKQAFATAGRLFEVIEDTKGRDVVVMYGDAQLWLDRLLEGGTTEERRKALRRLQGYTIKLSEYKLKKLENALDPAGEKILVLKKEYYSLETGVGEEPGEMDFLSF